MDGKNFFKPRKTRLSRHYFFPPRSKQREERNSFSLSLSSSPAREEIVLPRTSELPKQERKSVSRRLLTQKREKIMASSDETVAAATAAVAATALNDDASAAAAAAASAPASDAPADPSPSSEEQKIDPWNVSAGKDGVDYDKLSREVRTFSF